MTASLESPPRSRRRILLYALGLTAVAGLAGLGFWYARTNAQIDPPTFETAEVDPAIVRALEEKSAAVRRSRTARDWGELGMTFFAHEFTPQALRCFRQAERLEPDEPRWPYFQALGLVPELAVGKLRRTVKLCDNSPDAPRLRLAETLEALDQSEAAADQFAQLLRKDPENARAHLGMARLAHQRGELKKSLNHLSYPVKDERTRKAAYLLLARVHQERKDSAAADQAFHKANKLAKDAPWPDPFDEEMAGFRTGLKGARVRALKLFRQGRLAEAVSLLKETARDYPTSVMALTLLGDAYTRQGDLPAAEAVLNKALKVAPSSTDALFRLGVVLYRQNRAREAAAKYRRAIELQPGFGTAYFNLAHCLLMEGDRPAAIAALRSAVEAMPEFAEARRTLGAQLAESGQHAEAIVQFRAALKLDPDDRKARDLLEVALKRNTR